MRSFVTGGTRGIGRAVARSLLAAGGSVTITGRQRVLVEQAVRELEGEHPDRVAGIALDVRDSGAVDAALADAAGRFGGLDAVVNNAGVGVYGPVETMSNEDWRLVMDTNVSGPFHVTRSAIPWLRQSGGGWIINIASLAGAHPFAHGSAYCASKAALIALSEATMQELRHDNIRVSVVLPGSVATSFSSTGTGDDSWKLSADDVASVVAGLLAHPPRSLPSRVEIRPSRPRKG